MMMAAILTMGFAACSSTDDDEEGEQPEKQKPEVPISDSD
jgi:type IV pilus biogenesis protein CpaD/CtpE